MTGEKLIDVKLLKAAQRLEEADVLFEKKFFDSVISRLYYALFYSASGCLLVKKIFSKTHSGVKNKFHQSFIKPGIFNEDIGSLYTMLFEERNDADYGDFAVYTTDEIEPLIAQTKNAVSILQQWAIEEYNRTKI